MREEKKYLVEEVEGHLNKSSHVFLADFNKMTVSETRDLRKSLSKESAEFHVVKNSVLSKAAARKNLPDMGTLAGQTAIIVGGKNPSEIAKILLNFYKTAQEKCSIKLAVMQDKLMSAAEVEALSKLPSLEVLRAQLLGLLNKPAQQLLYVFNAVPQGVLNVLDAKAKKG